MSQHQLNLPPSLVTKRELDRHEEASRHQIGRCVVRMLQIAGLSVKEGAVLLGLHEHAQLSRWMAGTERPHLDRIHAQPQLSRAWIQAEAEVVVPRVTIKVAIELETREKVG